MTPWTAARQAPLSMGFSRQEHCNGLPCPERHCNHALFPWSHQPGCRATSSRALNIPSLLPRGLFWRTASFCLCIAHCLLFRSQIENKQTRKEKKPHFPSYLKQPPPQTIITPSYFLFFISVISVQAAITKYQTLSSLYTGNI